MKFSGFSVVFLFIFALTACKKFRIESNVPACIEESAKEKTKSTTSVYATILEYEFQSKLVYVFDLNAGETDSRAEIYSADCKLLGILGGPEKNTIINGEEFKNATFKRKVWPAKN
jgi:hypothetical protein